jgi:protein involved in polysaccharide export with SLBB domain
MRETALGSLCFSRSCRETVLLLGFCLWLVGNAAACVATAVGVSRPTPLSQFLALSRASVTQGYRFQPGDLLTTRLYFNPQLDEEVQVRPDGNISLSLIGELRAAGKTAGELSAEITKAYAQYFVKPTAVVIVRQFAGYRVFTAGELRNPGQLSLLTGAHTVLDSLANAGGVTDDGTLTHVILVRRLPEQKQPMVAELDLADAISGRDPSQDVTLMPNDLIYVPRSGAANLNLALKQYLWNNLNMSTNVSFGASYNVSPYGVTNVPGGTTIPRTMTPGSMTPTVTTPTTTPMPMR